MTTPPSAHRSQGGIPGLAPDIVRTTREYLVAHLRPLREQAAAGKGGMDLARRTAAVFDGLLSAYFLGASAQRMAQGAKGRVALLAVGGFGRGTLGPGSDLDLVVLADRSNDPSLTVLAETFLYPLWDSGVSVGHAVRSADELVALARDDLRTATTLLDARCIAGDRELARETLARGWRALFDSNLGGFIDGLTEEMAGRHQRYGATVYLLEPDVKYGRGALRDLDIARWALGAKFRAPDFAEALRRGALSSIERAVFEDAREFFWRLRSQLHARTGRRADRLTFDEQEEAAVRLGYVDDVVQAEDPVRALGEASEQLMSTYYRHARAVATTLDHVLDRCRPGRGTMDPLPRAERVTEEISRFDGCLCLVGADALRRDPVVALRIIELALAREVPLAAATREHITAAARDPAWTAALRARPDAAAAFMRLLTHAGRAELRPRHAVPVSGTGLNTGSVLAELHDLGLLLAMVPEFGPVTGRVQHDVYHVYTVDVHSVAAVDRLHAFARADLATEFPLPTHLMAEMDRKDLLCLATLLHDVGKSHGGRQHSRVGADMAPAIAERLGLGADDGRAVARLVLEHLTLYHMATRRDLGDPATLSQLTESVGDPWHLRALYLLTVADLSTTSPTAMTSWKARMLDEVYHRGSAALADRPEPTAAHGLALVRQALDRAPAEDRTAVERFLARMPERYLLATPPEAILRHARALTTAEGSAAPRVHLAAVAGDATGELLEVLIAAPDRPGLLALLAALLYANRLDVQSAQIYSRGGDAVDVFVVRRAVSDRGDLTRLAERLPRQLDDLLDGRTDPDALVQASRGGGTLSRPEPAVRTEVTLQNDASEAATVVEVFGRDRPGFLYAVARAHHRLGLAISLSKVNTEGRRVADVFYVTDAAGAKVDPDRFGAIRDSLVAAITGT